MARKHAKKFSRKASVERTLVTPERTERKVLTNPTTGQLEVVHVVTPAVYTQGKAHESTSTKGQRNVVADKPKPMGGKK